MGYRSIDYKDIMAERNRTNVRFYLNTGEGPGTYCRKCNEAVSCNPALIFLLQNITICWTFS